MSGDGEIFKIISHEILAVFGGDGYEFLFQGKETFQIFFCGIRPDAVDGIENTPEFVVFIMFDLSGLRDDFVDIFFLRC